MIYHLPFCSTSDIQSTTSTFVDNIPLISARTDDASGYQQHGGTNDQDDDIIGEEVRPLPIDSSMDSRMRALHALLQDHTYVQLPKKTAAAATSSAPNTVTVTVNTVAESSLAGFSNRSSGEKSLVTNRITQSLAENSRPFAEKTIIATTQNVQEKTANPVATYVKQQQLQHQQNNPVVASPRKNASINAGGSISMQQKPKTNAIKYNQQTKQALVSTVSSASTVAATTLPSFIPGFPFTYNTMGKGTVYTFRSLNLDRKFIQIFRFSFFRHR